jgi:hypothetical protein
VGVGENRAGARYSFLPEQAIAFADEKRTVWRLDAEQRRQLKDCQAATPGG